MSKEAMQMALDALEQITPDWRTSIEKHTQLNNSIEALEAALAQPENKFNPDWDAMAVMVEEQQRMAKRIEELTELYNLQSSRAMDYASSFMRSKREWVGLTAEEAEHIVDSYWNDPPMFIEAIEAKLRERNT